MAKASGPCSVYIYITLMPSMNFYMIVPFKIFFIILLSLLPNADPTSVARGRVSYLGSVLARVPEPKSFSLVIFRRPDPPPDPRG